MLLDTIRCVEEGCFQEFTEDVPRWHLMLFARDAGWTFSADEEMAWCPEHTEEERSAPPVWLVGCWTCDFEEGYDSEEEAKNEYMLHECEPDTWIKNPEQVRDMEARKAARRSVETVRVTAALSEATAKQDRIESYANQWLRIRNFFLFWKKEHIHERDEHHG